MAGLVLALTSVVSNYTLLTLEKKLKFISFLLAMSLAFLLSGHWISGVSSWLPRQTLSRISLKGASHMRLTEHRSGVLVCPCNPSTCELETRVLGAQGHLQLYIELKAGLETETLTQFPNLSNSQVPKNLMEILPLLGSSPQLW